MGHRPRTEGATISRSGSVWDIAFSPDAAQTYLVVPDGTNQQIWVLNCDTLQVGSAFRHAGRWAGQLYGAHNIAADSSGNLYIIETHVETYAI